MTDNPTSNTRLTALPLQLFEMDDGVILKRGCTEFKISGAGAAEAVRLVLTTTANSGVTPEEIYERFAAPDRPMVEQLIEQLVSRNLLVSNETVTPTFTHRESHLDVFYWHFGEKASQVTDRLNSRRMLVMGVNCISRQLAASLNASGVNNFRVVDHPLLRNLRLFDETGQLKTDQWPVPSQSPITHNQWSEKLDLQPFDCLIATCDFGGFEALRELNRFCLERRCRFLPIVLKNLVGYVGPLVIPGETACLECLLARQNSHLKDPQSRRGGDVVAFEGQAFTGFHPSMASILGDIAAFELTKFYSGILPKLNVGRLIEINLLATKLVSRKVLKIPRCLECSPLRTQSSMAATKDPSISDRTNR